MTKEMKYLMQEAGRGNHQCQHLLAIRLENEGYDSFFVQVQFRKAAEGGYVLAQRWLGILGLCNALHENEYYSKEADFNSDLSIGIGWLEKAAANRDAVSSYILAKCRQLGIGYKKDEASAEAMFKPLLQHISFEETVSVSVLFDYIVSRKHLRPREVAACCCSLRSPKSMAAA